MFRSLNQTIPSSKHYRPDIDGIRAIAILSVLLFHASPINFQAGFIGVDIFFVISGFLITSIILSKTSSYSFSLKEFYVRRVRRIFPALICLLLFNFIVGWFVLFPNEYSQLAKHIIGGGTFFNNILLWQESGYFDLNSNLKPLLHLWSLSIEEQFYLFWPMTLLLFSRQTRLVGLILIGIASLSFIFNILTLSTDTIASFYLPATRIWELAIGGLLSYLLTYNNKNSRYYPSFSIIGLLLIGIGFVLISKDTLYPGWYALYPVLGTMLLISGGPHSIINKYLLSNRLFVWVGLISYPLYLWHWSLLSYSHILSHGQPDRLSRFTIVIISFLLAWLTYRFIEQPIRKKAVISTQALILSMLCCVLVGVFAYSNKIKPRLSNPNIGKLVIAENDWDYPTNFQKLEHYKNIYVHYAPNQNSQTSGILFLGDSHTEQYAPRILEKTNSTNINKNIYYATYGGCPPIPHAQQFTKKQGCINLFKNAIKLLNQNNIQTIVIAAFWSQYFTPDSSKYMNQERPYNNQFLSSGLQKEMRKNFSSFIHKLSKDKKVYVVLDTLNTRSVTPTEFYSGSRLSLSLQHTKKIPKYLPISYIKKEVNHLVSSITKKNGGNIINPNASLSYQDQFLVSLEDGSPIFKDSNHLRASFVRKHANFIDIVLLG